MRTNGKAQKLDHQALQALEMLYVLETETQCQVCTKNRRRALPLWEMGVYYPKNASRESLDWGILSVDRWS